MYTHVSKCKNDKIKKVNDLIKDEKCNPIYNNYKKYLGISSAIGEK
jgi:hypothetical protein